MEQSISEIEKIIDTEVENWIGNCGEICAKLIKYNVIQGEIKFGHYIGYISPNSIFSQNGKIDYVIHSWIETTENEIIDPTLWTITNEKPYIFTGKNNGKYIKGKTMEISFYLS